MKPLLDKNADVDAAGYYGNELQAASAGAYKQIVKLLLEKGADVNATGGHYGNALQAASATGHEESVKLLLDKKADVNATGGYYGSALHAVSLEGHQQIVQLLLDNGGDVNATGGIMAARFRRPHRKATSRLCVEMAGLETRNLLCKINGFENKRLFDCTYPSIHFEQHDDTLYLGPCLDDAGSCL